jgi:glycosyltransferase involved in cell wall biosynthesis
LIAETRDATHVFSPARAFPLIWSAYREALRSGCRVGLYSEEHDRRGVRGLLRRVRGIADRIRFGSRNSFVLATGKRGVEWFEACGYPAERLHRFGYFVEPPPPASAADTDAQRERTAVRLAFIGQLIHRKGVDVLLRALAMHRGGDWQLDIFGAGPDADRLAASARAAGIGGQVRFRGVASNSVTRAELPEYDLLVLPSRQDGWGAVVNEALMAGVPVVCSDVCGAADLLRDDRGTTFRSGSAADLSRVLAERLEAGPVLAGTRAAIREWSRRIEGAAAATYMMSVVDAAPGDARPTPPWLEDEE